MTDQGDANPLAQPQDLTDLINYQDGAVVSRTLFKAPSGSITLFAFDAGQGLSEHSTPHDAMVMILDGESRIGVGGEEHTVSAGEALLLPANVPHGLSSEVRFKMVLTMIRE